MVKYCLSIVAIVMAFVTAPVSASEGHIGQATLASFGLGDIQIMSDQQGMKIRGQGGNASAMGLSIVTGFLIDPSTNNFVGGTDAQSAMANASNAGKYAPVIVSSNQESLIVLQLDVVIDGTPFFNGYLIGNSGGSARATAP